MTRARSMASLAAGGLLLAGIGACIDVPTGSQPKCSSNSDCNQAAGEVCDEGLCWGNPPPGPFAAALAAPSDRTDVVATELPNLVVPDHGWLGDLVLDAPVTFSGRVEAFCAMPTVCDGTSIAATITVTRPSLIPGAKPFLASTSSKDGVAGRSDSFSIVLPRTRPGDPPYTITIVPDGRGDQPPSSGTSAAELAPPMRMTTMATTDLSQTITLGSDSSQVITGTVTDELGRPLQDYRVVALGTWDASATASEVSTVAYTTTGEFSLTIADGITNPVELVAQPYDLTAVAPVLHINAVPATSGTHTIAQPHNLGTKLPLAISVTGVADAGGAVKPVSGARVTLTGVYTQAINAHTSAVLEADGTTDSNGVVDLSVLDGAALASAYKLRIIPPASSNLGVVYDAAFALPKAGNVMATEIQLPVRLILNGTVVDANGQPAGNLSVTARPSLRFDWSLDDAPQQFLAQVPAATTVTDNSGAFKVYVDPLIAGVWGHYDLVLDPPTGTDAPSWTLPDVEVPRTAGQSSFSVATVTLPAASYIHGRITDAGGNPVESAELRIYQTTGDNMLCTQVTHAPAGCTVPAQVVGHATADTDGIVRLTLPRP